MWSTSFLDWLPFLLSQEVLDIPGVPHAYQHLIVSIFFSSHPHGIWKVPGQGTNLHYSSNQATVQWQQWILNSLSHKGTPSRAILIIEYSKDLSYSSCVPGPWLSFCFFFFNARSLITGPQGNSTLAYSQCLLYEEQFALAGWWSDYCSWSLHISV